MAMRQETTDETYGMNEEQLAEIRASFRTIDRNGDGRISSYELIKAQQALGCNPTKQEALDMIKEVDSDGSGFIEFPEYVKLMAERYEALEYEQMMMAAAFKHFDKDGSGTLTREELYEFLVGNGEIIRKSDEIPAPGEPLDDKEFNEVMDDFMKDFDEDGDGKVNLEEFTKMLCQRRQQQGGF